MDRSDSSLLETCKSIEDKLEIPVISLQLPVIENGVFSGGYIFKLVAVTVISFFRRCRCSYNGEDRL